MKDKQLQKRAAEIVEQMRMTCQQHIRANGSNMFMQATGAWSLENTLELFEWAQSTKN